VSPEDMQRFEVESTHVALDDTRITIDCRDCYWYAELDLPLTLAELVQRAEEHTEVCP